ncbi:DNA translocase FtsK [Candidatus Hepatincola sp. Pdp]
MKASSKILSFSLMLCGAILLSILCTYITTDVSFNSTGFNPNQSLFYTSRNYIADTLLQVFGVIAYFIPILFLVWSYHFYSNPKLSYTKSRLLTAFLFLILAPALIYKYFSYHNAGILGLYFSSSLIFNQFSYLGIVLVICLGLWALNLPPTKIFYFFKHVYILFSLTWQAIVKRFKHTKYNLHNVNNEEHSLKKTTSFKLIPDLNFLKSKNFSHLPLKNIEESLPNDLSTFEDNLDNDKLSLLQKIKANQQAEEETTHNMVESPLFTNTQTTSGINHSTINENNIIKDYAIPISFLNSKKTTAKNVPEKELATNAINLEKIFMEFGIKGKIVNIETGPVVTLYEMIIPAGVKTSKVIALETDIALRMKATSVRIAIVPGKDVLGIEIPNQKRSIVYLKEVLQSKEFQKSSAKLPIILGNNINGKPIVSDLSTMPHLLIAGTTGSGKSVGVNAMILSLLYKLPPEECKLIMIDPKMLELSIYQDIPHLITPVVINPKQAITALKWVVKEMEYRYYQMSLLGVRNLAGFNEKIKNKIAIQGIQQKTQASTGNTIEFQHLPYIVVIIDEMADLMMVAGKEVESAVQRLAQMARASGIHLIMATQRPSVDVITGTIKANFPTRISFQVSSKIDSRTILGEQGGEQLLGKGDMLYMSGVSRIQRIHGPFISDDEVLNVVEYLKKLSKPNYLDNILTDDEANRGTTSSGEKDDLFDEAITLIKKEQRASTSFLQRKFQIGYNRAARLMEQLEEAGVISQATATGKREILIK